jgi:hypothetical protein
MLETGVSHLVDLTKELRALSARLQTRRFHDNPSVGEMSGAWGETDREILVKCLDAIAPWLTQLDLHSSLDRVNRIRTTVIDIEAEEHDYQTSDEAITQIKVLLETLSDELDRNVFLYLAGCGRMPIAHVFLGADV